jgi:predicted transcriptional regulator
MERTEKDVDETEMVCLKLLLSSRLQTRLVDLAGTENVLPDVIALRAIEEYLDRRKASLQAASRPDN